MTELANSPVRSPDEPEPIQAASRHEISALQLTYDEKRENWRKAMLNVKSVVERYGIPFPAIPEVGITGEEVDDVSEQDIIPIF